MEYVLKSGPVKKPKFTIGYLDENAYDEYHSYITAGFFEAAKKHRVNAVRFGYFASHIASKHVSQINMVLDHIQQYELDGLLFLGWARAAAFDNHEDFKKRFSSIPIFSVGAGFPDIPHAYFPGDQYTREVLLHLVTVHHFKRIAFVAPFWPDNRKDIYINTMKEYGIYHPELYVSEKELAHLEVYQRGRGAVSILLDERRTTFDAIVSLYNAETEGIMDELRSRGVDVPKDVAVTSYEDGEIGKFYSPPFTTVYFPWKELGFYACEKMIELLSNGRTELSSMVPGRVVLRESCGCVSTSVDFAKAGKIRSKEQCPEKVNFKEMSDALKKETNAMELDTDALLKAFWEDIYGNSGMHFMNKMETELRKITDSYSFSKIVDVVSILRKVVLPYITDDTEVILRAGDIFQQSQVLVREKMACVKGIEELELINMNQALQDISQILIANFSVVDLMNSLELNLPKVDIPNCYIFIFKEEKEEKEENDEELFKNCVLAFEYCEHKRLNIIKIEPHPARQLLSEVLFPKDRPYSMMANLLNVGDEYLGFALFEPGPMDERFYQALSIHISTALRCAIILEKLDSSYKRLVQQAHREGMADIATGIINNLGNVLNGVNTSVHRVKEVINTSPVEDLMKANVLLENNLDQIENFICNDKKGKKLMQFYLKLGEPFVELKEELSFHINKLDDKINSINEIIVAQQSYAGIKTNLEEFDLVNILEDAFKMHMETLEKYKIEVVKDYRSKPKALIQRIKLFYILVSLIKNAREALEEKSPDLRKLTLSVYEDEEGNYICITDTGCGIPQNSLERIFAYGYTTKKDGHGFELHSCANYMTEMGGKIWAKSDGPGKGAMFVLKFNKHNNQ